MEGEQTTEPNPQQEPVSAASIRRPVVVRRQPGTPSKPTAAVRRGPVVAVKPHRENLSQASRIGQVDFSANILSPEASAHLRKRSHASATQRLFFDASIAIAAISFTILVIAHH